MDPKTCYLYVPVSCPYDCEVREMEKGGLIFWYTYKLYPLATMFILEQFCGNYPSLEYFTNFTVVYQYNVFANYHRIDMPYD